MFWAFKKKKSLCMCHQWEMFIYGKRITRYVCISKMPVNSRVNWVFSWLHTQDFESRVQTHIKWSRKVRCQIFAGQLFLRSWWREKCELKHNSSIVIYVSYWCNSRRGCYIDKQHCNRYIQRYLDPISYCCCGLA